MLFDRYASEEFDDNYDDCLVKKMKREIINKPNKVFINGGK